VPAGASVPAEVYADQPKQDQVIGAELFTIPGLWEGIQDKIYAESRVDSIKYQQKLRRIISQDDIDKAIMSTISASSNSLFRKRMTNTNALLIENDLTFVGHLVFLFLISGIWNCGMSNHQIAFASPFKINVNLIEWNPLVKISRE
jgi:hypothetical protein